MESDVTSDSETRVAPRQSTSTRFVFTFNNPEFALDFSDSRVRIACWQLEIGAEGTPHYQGYVVLKNSARFGTVKNIIGSERVHVEVARGASDQCIDYCTKSETQIEGPWFYPDEATVRVNHQGTRTDLQAAADMVVAGRSFKELPNAVFCRNFRGLQELRKLHHPAKTRDKVRVLCIKGPPGIGKTTAVMEHTKEEPYSLTVTEAGALWGDGYDGEDAVILDDYAGQLPIKVFNQICDRWTFWLPTKGAFVAARWHTVFILTNAEPSTWYCKYGQNQDVLGAVYRRIGYGPYDGKDPDHVYMEFKTREELLGYIAGSTDSSPDVTALADEGDGVAGTSAAPAPAPVPSPCLDYLKRPVAVDAWMPRTKRTATPPDPVGVRSVSVSHANEFDWLPSDAQRAYEAGIGQGRDKNGDVVTTDPQLYALHLFHPTL